MENPANFERSPAQPSLGDQGQHDWVHPVSSGKVVRDAMRYRWLKKHLRFSLHGWNGPDFLKNATESKWGLRTDGLFRGTNKEPQNIDQAIDQAMKARD